MDTSQISSAFNFELHKANVLGSKMAYIDTGPSQSDKVVVFLHGNPTSSYLWRNIIPHVQPAARCIAPDLIGMGYSNKPPNMEYRFFDHSKYIEAFIDQLVPDDDIILVLHDWGAAIGLDWAQRHEHRVGGLVLMEFVHPIPSWEDFPELARETFRSFRDPETSRKLLIDDNAFVDQFLPQCVVRPLSEAEMAHYREPFKSPASREPVWRFPNELPIAGSPADVFEILEPAHDWLLDTGISKLLFYATPGGLISESKAEWYKDHMQNTRAVGIGPGIHYVQEDNPHLIGAEITSWLHGFTKP